MNSEHWPMNQSNIKKPPNVTQRCQTHWKISGNMWCWGSWQNWQSYGHRKVKWGLIHHAISPWKCLTGNNRQSSQIRSWCSKSIRGKTQWRTIGDRLASHEASPKHYWSSVEISYQHPKLALKCPSRRLEIYFCCLKNKQACLTEFRLCWRMKVIISVIDFQAH